MEREKIIINENFLLLCKLLGNSRTDLMRKYRIIIYGIVLILTWFIFYNVKAIFKPYLYPIINDTLQFFWPEGIFYSKSIKNGIIPLWNPFIEFGQSHIGHSYTVFFSPLNLFLWRFCSFETCYALASTIPVLIGAIGVFFLSRIFNVSREGSLISSLVYLNCGIMQMFYYHLPFLYGMILLPWILYAIEYMIAKQSVRGFVLLVITLTILLLCTNPQYIFYNILASIVYFIIRVNLITSFFNKTDFKIILTYSALILLAIGLSILIGNIQTLMTMDMIEVSNRMELKGTINVEDSLSPFCFLLHLLPSFMMTSSFHLIPCFKGYGPYTNAVLFVGTISSILAIIALLTIRKTAIRKQCFALIAIFCLSWFIASAQYNVLYKLIFSFIPILGVFRIPIKALFIAALSISLLAGIGFDFLFDKTFAGYLKRTKYYIAFTLSVVLLILSVFYTTYTSLTTHFFFKIGAFIIIINLLMIFVISLGYYKKNQKVLAICLISVFILTAYQIEFILHTKQLNTSYGATENQFGFQKDTSLLLREHEVIKMLKKDNSLFRIAPYRPIGDGYYDMGFSHRVLGNDRRGILSVQLIPMMWGQAFGIHSIGHMYPGYHSALSPLDSAKLIDLAYESIFKEKNTSILDMINVKYVLSSKELNHPKLKLLEYIENVFPEKNIEFNPNYFETGPVYVYVNKNVWPRIFLASKIIFMEQKNTLDYIKNHLLDNKTVIVHDQDLVNLNESSTKDQLFIKKYGLSEIEIESDTINPTLLVISDHFAKGWHYFINNKEVECYQVNYCFRGLRVPAGKNYISMKYLPDSFIIGLKSMVIGIFLLIFFTIIFNKIIYLKKLN